MFKRMCQLLLLAGVAGPASAAVLLQADADSVGFFVNPDPNYSVAIDLTANPIHYRPGDTLPIEIDFVDLDGSGGHGVGASQFLQVFDLTQQIGANPNPPQDINVFLNGNIPLGLANPAFQIMFTGVSGTISGTTFASQVPTSFCTGTFCSSGALGADLIPAPPGQDASFLYHDFHITFSTDADPNIAPFDITSLSFGGAADRVAVVTVPEPATLALLGVSLVGLAFTRRRQ